MTFQIYIIAKSIAGVSPPYEVKSEIYLLAYLIHYPYIWLKAILVQTNII